MFDSFRGPRTWLVFAGGLALAASCSNAPRDANKELRSATVRALPPADLSAPETRVRFEWAEGSLATSSDTFDAVVAPRGELTVVPHDGRRRGAPLLLETRRIARGDADIGGAVAGGATSTTDGIVVLRRGSIEERIENDVAGVEQSWRFDERPHGAGDVVVHVAARGARYTTATSAGLHFDGGAVGVRYGTATWIDARGVRTVIDPVFRDGEIEIAIPSAVVDASVYPAVLDPIIGAEREVDTPAAPGPASGERSYPLVARAPSGPGYFSVWFDRRAARPSFYGSKLASNGAVSQPIGFVIAGGIAVSARPVLVSSPAGYLLAWNVSYYDVNQQTGVYVIRFDVNANPIDPAPVRIAASQGYVYAISAAHDGAEWMVAWSRNGGATGSDIFGVRVPATGPPMGAVLTLSNAMESEYEPIVFGSATGSTIAWTAYASPSYVLRARRFAQSGQGVGSVSTLASAPGIYDLAGATNGTESLVTWGQSGDIYGVRLDATGTPVGGAFPIDTDVNNYDNSPRAAWDGNNYFVGYVRGSSLVAKRVTLGGIVGDAAPFNIVPNYGYETSLASDGSSIAVIGREFVSIANQPSRSEIRLTPVPKTAAGVAPTPNAQVLLSRAANAQTEATAAWLNDKYVATWVDTRDTSPTIWASRVDATGQPATPLRLFANPNGTLTYSQITKPRIAASATGFLVVFYAIESNSGTGTSRRGIFGVSLDANGGAPVLRDVSIQTTGYQDREPDVAFDGTSFLVVYESSSAEGNGIGARRVNPTNGSVLDAVTQKVSLVSQTESRLTPSVAYDGSSYFVAWTTSRSGGAIQVTHIFGTRVDKSTLVPLDGELVICDAFLLQRLPHVSANKRRGGFLVVWEDNRTSLDTADVYGARIDVEGQNQDAPSGMKIASGAYDEARPRASANAEGSSYVVAWRDFRSKQTYDIYGSWIGSRGTNHDPLGVMLSSEAGDEEVPSLAAANDGKVLLTYQRLDPAAGSYRLRARIVDTGAPAAAACARGEECSSRSCITGVCCSSECGGCGACNVDRGNCTPLAAGAEPDTCKNYKCKGTIECPASCESDADCAQNATCDPAEKKCVSRVACIDNVTLKDLTGKTTSCAPFTCLGEACRTQCGSVDDCAPGFVCDFSGRCGPAPSSSDGGCATAPSGGGGGGIFTAVAMAAILAGLARVRRKRA